MTETYVRIQAEDIRPGDRVARARTHPFHLVTDVRPGGTAVWLTYESGARDRPRRTASWWKAVS